ELLGRRHADVDGIGEPPDRSARLLPERRVRLVADDELVSALRERADVTREPGVGLNRDRVAPQRLLPVLDRGAEAVAVALGRQVARELLNEQAAVREDEDAHCARPLDEAGGRDRLSGCRRMAEAEAAYRTGIVALVLLALVLLALVLLALLVILGFLERVSVP